MNNPITLTRNSVATYFDAVGALQTVGVNEPRIDWGQRNSSGIGNGLWLEVAQTNQITYGRDLTNAAWTKTDATAAKDQIGLDGVANSASSLTATADNGKATFTCGVLSSTTRGFIVYLKRLSGTGTVEISANNTDFTAVVLTSEYQRFFVNGVPSLSGTVAIRLGTSGDAVAVDAAMVTTSSGTSRYSSPILTTGATATRQTDVCTLATSAFPFIASPGTLFAKCIPVADDVYPSFTIRLDDGTTDNVIEWVTGTAGNLADVRYRIVVGGVQQSAQSYTMPQAPVAVALSYGSTVRSAMNGTQNGSASGVSLPTVNRLYMTGVCFVSRLTYAPYASTAAELEAMTDG